MRRPSFFVNYTHGGTTSRPSPRMEISLHVGPCPANPPAKTKWFPKMAAQLCSSCQQRIACTKIQIPTRSPVLVTNTLWRLQVQCPCMAATEPILSRLLMAPTVTQASQSDNWWKRSGAAGHGSAAFLNPSLGMETVYSMTVKSFGLS